MFALDAEMIKKARVTQYLIAINIIFYIIFNPDYNFTWWFALAQYNQAILQGEVWRLITSIFLHGDILHIFYNMFGLLIFGATMENITSKRFYIGLYLFSGFIGSFFTLILTSPLTISVGASGAIFGLMGYCFVILSRENPYVFLYGIIYLAFAISKSFAPGIGTWAHIFGLLTGLLSAYIIIKKQEREKKRNQLNFY
ncbi:MAG: rhomboid family intramembrane serine protease [Promethearchaeota archaeon]